MEQTGRHKNMSGGSGHELRTEFTVGFKLLNKFQAQWEHVHAKSENNVIKAKTALRKLNQVEQSSIRRLCALDNFTSSYKSLSKLEEQIKNIDADLRLLEDCFAQIEDLLLVLKNYKERVETNQYVDNMEANYDMQVRKQRCLSDARKEKLKIEHLRRVEAFEQEQQHHLEERRQILERAFEEEKTRYLDKKKGA